MDHGQFAAQLSEAAQLRRAGELLAREAALQFDRAQKRDRDSRRHGFSIVRAISAAATNGLRDGIEREYSEELARQRGTTHDPHRFYLPFAAFRTLQVGTSTAAGYLVGTDNRPAVDALFPVSTVVRLGAQVIDGLQADVTMPTISTAGSANWVAELGTATAGPPVFGQLAYQPIAAVATTDISRQLLLQSAAERMVGAHLMRVVGAKIDLAALQGTGTGEPLGLQNTTGVDIQDGTSYALATAHAQLAAVANANGNDEAVRFLATPDVRELLALREVGTSVPPFVWQDNMVAGKPAYVSTNVGTDTIIAGDFSQMAVLLWGGGLLVETNPYEKFQAGIVALRVIADCNVAVLQPGAFSIATSVS